MKTIELELTYLAKELPSSLITCDSKQVVDVYFPASTQHPTLRIRQSGKRYEITKKTIAQGNDSSHMIEQTIELTAEEFTELTTQGGKRVAKTRYYYDYRGRTAEIDVFEEKLTGLVLVDFEFTDRSEQLAFVMPDFCLAEVTQEGFIAGGMVAGKSYEDIAVQLEQFGYRALHI